VQFGMINFAVILVVGLFLCRELGVFKGENVPDFLVSQKDLYFHFPSLAPPPDPNAPPSPKSEPVDPPAASLGSDDEPPESAYVFDETLDRVQDDNED